MSGSIVNGHVYFCSDDDINKILAYYRTELKKNGYGDLSYETIKDKNYGTLLALRHFETERKNYGSYTSYGTLTIYIYNAGKSVIDITYGEERDSTS